MMVFRTRLVCFVLCVIPIAFLLNFFEYVPPARIVSTPIHYLRSILSNLNSKISNSRVNQMDMALQVELASESSKLNYSSRTSPNVHRWPDLMREPRMEFDPNFKNPCWMKDGKLRCLPYMLLIGVKKCGTTYLFRNVIKHPDFANPGFMEAQWFSRGRFKGRGKGIESYAKLFNKAASTIINKSVRLSSGKLSNHRQITGEKSPSNLHLNNHWKDLPGNENLQEPKYVNLDYIHHFMPSVKIIIVFRNPVDRLYSDYFHEYGTLMHENHPCPEEFHRLVEKILTLYEKCFQKQSVRTCVYDSNISRISRFQIQLGIYYIYWKELLRVFPRNNILVLQNEDLRTDFRENLRTIFKFLGIQNLSDHEMSVYRIGTKNKNSSKNKPMLKETAKTSHKPMLEETAKILYKFYQRFNKVMAEQTGDDSFLYKR